MPSRGARICGCGKLIPSGKICQCQEKAARERKARHDAKRPTARQRGYTREWETESRKFLKAHPICNRCGNHAEVVDHILAHKGDERLFWNRANWQPLCRHCHNSAKQAEERRKHQEVN